MSGAGDAENSAVEKQKQDLMKKIVSSAKKKIEESEKVLSKSVLLDFWAVVLVLWNRSTWW